MGFQRSTVDKKAQKESKKADKAIYPHLRDQALKITAAQLGITLTSREQVYGVIMDWEITDGTMTLVAFQTGDASIYLSSGGGFIGGGQHGNVNIAAKKYVAATQSFTSKAAPITTISLPGKKEVQFCLLTGNSVLFKRISMDAIESGTSEWRTLFTEANNVITEYREVSGDR